MITHCSFHLNIDYWDYYILCHLDIDTARVLQRMEYWDSTKAGGNSHAEAINDRLEELGEAATQDTSRFVFKGEEELYWELMGSCGEKNIPRIMHFLEEDLHYLVSRKNPFKGFDRTKQFEFQGTLVQQHINKISALIQTFLAVGRRLSPVQYAIEALTREGVYIDALTVEQIAAKLGAMHIQMHLDEDVTKYEKGKKPGKAVLPKFIRLALKKDEKHGFSADVPFPFPQIAEIEAANGSLISANCGNVSADCGIISANRGNRFRNLPPAIPVITNSNYNQVITINDDDSPDSQKTQPGLAHANDSRTALSILENLTDEEMVLVASIIQERRQHPQQKPEGDTQAPPEEISPPSKEINREASNQQNGKQTASKTSEKKGKTRTSKVIPTALALAILDAWDHVNGKKMPRTKENVDAAEELALVEAAEEDLSNVRERLLGQKDGWWKQRGVRLKDIANHFHLAAEGSPSRSDNKTSSGNQTPDTGQKEPGKRKLLRRVPTAQEVQQPELVMAAAVQEARSVI